MREELKPIGCQNCKYFKFATISLCKNVNFLEFTKKYKIKKNQFFFSNSSQNQNIHLALMSACWRCRKICALTYSDLLFTQTCVIRWIEGFLWLFLARNPQIRLRRGSRHGAAAPLRLLRWTFFFFCIKLNPIGCQKCIYLQMSKLAI